MSNSADVGDLENLGYSLPSWVSKHLGEKSFMSDEVHQLPSSPPEGSPLRDDSPDYRVEPEMSTTSPLEKEVNVMTQGDLDLLRITCSFPDGIQIRIPDEDETIFSGHLGEVAFYEAAFHADLRFPVYPTSKRILNFYNICPAQFSPNA